MIWVIARFASRPNAKRFYDESFHHVEGLHGAYELIAGHHRSVKSELLVRHTIILGHELKPEEIG